MDKIEKLLLKVSQRDRIGLLNVLNNIINNDKDLKIIKIKNTDFYRARFKQFRIIFHREEQAIIIDSIKLRDNNTYKNL